MQSVIIVIHLMIVLAMVGLILLQKSEGGGLGMGSGGGGFMSSRGTTNVLTRTTAVLAATFFATSLILSMFAGMDRKPRSVLTPGAAVAGRAGVTRHRRSADPEAGCSISFAAMPAHRQPAAPSGPQVPRSQ